MKKTNLSVVISAYNEEKKIEKCLHSVEFADEIILIDNSSTDNTVKIASKYTKKIFSRENNPMLNINKNYGFTKATGDWILSLDADERVSKELKDEILEKLDDVSVSGYWIPRKNYILGKLMQYTGWYPDYQLRLFRRGKGKFAQENVHEMLTVEGEKEQLVSAILHENFDSISQLIHKHVAIYAPNEADDLIIKGYVFHWLDVIRFPAKEFMSRFFAREGYKDGLHGLFMSIFMAFYHFMIFAYIWEQKGFVQVDDKILEKVDEEMGKQKKELSFWFMNEKIKNANNSLQKISLKLKRVLS